MKSLRIACLLVPKFPLAAVLRGAPTEDCRPDAILDDRRLLIAVTAPAEQAGIRPGFSLTQARALLPQLIARPRDLEGEQAAQGVLLEVADSFSPIVEEEGPGVVYLDLTGGRNEREAASEMMARLAAAGLSARIGIAGSRLAAKVAARRSKKGPVVIPFGEEGTYLSPLPIVWLNPPTKLAETLERWGIGSIGALAALPTAELASRLGREGVALQKAARGVECRPLIGRRPPNRFSEEVDLEWTVTEMAPFLFLAGRALDRLASRLIAWGLACRRLRLTLRLDPSGEAARTLQLPAPTSDVKTLLALLRGEMEARPPGAPVGGFTLELFPEPPRQIQASLFGPAVQSPDLLATMIARLSMRLGADRIGAPGRVEGHLPERFAAEAYAPPPPPEISPLPESGPIGLAVRVLRPGVALEVKTRASSEPASLQSIRGKGLHPEIAGKVRVAAGPWRLEEGGWSDRPVTRDYWDVELFDGGLYRIFYDLRRRRWFADGIYG